jgi:hypothetical protein
MLQKDELTSQFLTWEARGRGYFVAPMPVELEPWFVPFFVHNLPYDAERIIDDGRNPSIGDLAALGLKKLFASKKPKQPEPPAINFVPFDAPYPVVVITVSFPKGHKTPFFETERLLIVLASCTLPVSFEIVAQDASITIQYTCASVDTRYLKSQLKAYFPTSSITEGKDVLFDLIGQGVQVYDFGLRHEFMRPLATSNSLTRMHI